MLFSFSPERHASFTLPQSMLCALAVSLLLVLPQTVQAQGHMVDDYTWDDVPVLPDTVHQMTEATVFLEHHIIMDRVLGEDDLDEYYLVHNQVFLRDQGSIERNNTLQFGIGGLLEKPTIQARSMTPDGKITVLEGDDFKFAEDEESGQQTLYFAYEGLEPGSVVEYILVRKKSANNKGDLEVLQRGLPILKQSVQLAAPQGWGFAFKSYNGAPEMVASDDTSLGYWLWRAETGFMPGLEDQPSSAMERLKPRIDFRLDVVYGNSAKAYSSFVNATKIYHASIHPELEKKDEKALSKLIKEMDLPDGEDRILAVESFVKTQFGYYEAYNPVLSYLPSVLENRVANDMGMTRLFAALFRELEIPYEVVLACDRFDRVIDPDFESFLPLQEIIFYLPDLDAYMDPGAMAYRAPYARMSLMASDALHIRNFKVGDGITGVGKVRYIPALIDTLNLHDHHFIVTFTDEDASTAKIVYKDMLMGYGATLQNFYDLLDAERQEEIVHDMLDHLVGDEEDPVIGVRYAKDKYFGKKRLSLEGFVETDRFSGSAGERRLFNIGELIGPQVEMYDSVARTLPVEELFNRRYLREFEITIPDGWVLQNADDLNFDVRLDMDGETPMAFLSEYTLEGNLLKVRVHEYYRTVRLPLEHYPAYRDVINAAADFNKVVLVLAKGQ